MNRLYKKISLMAVAAAGLGWTGANALTPAAEPTGTSQHLEQAPDIPADSITPGKMAVAAVSEEYKEIKERQFDGEDEATFYPGVMSLYLSATKALGLAEDSGQEQQLKAILLDINSLLMKGAFHYSGINNPAQMSAFARAYIDTQQLPIFSGDEFRRDPKVFPSLVYVAASGVYGTGDHESAIPYLELYLATGEDTHRENVCKYLGQACYNTKQYLKGINTLTNAIVIYPNSYDMVALGIQCCLEGGYADRLQPLLDRALLMNPGDEKLLNIQARAYESDQNYKGALDIYNQIAETHPNSLENTQRMATCNYNLGVQHYNMSIMEEDEKTAKKNRRQSKAYFGSASEQFEELLLAKPSSREFMRTLGVIYGCLDEQEKFADINTRLMAIGEKPLTMGGVPEMIGGPLEKGGGDQSTSSAIAAPSYQEYASAAIERQLGKWAQRGEFEKVEDYQRRVTEGGLAMEFERLKKETAKEYLDKYAFSFVPRDLKISPYDVNNESYQIATPYGDVNLKVPLKNGEAESFKSAWDNKNVEIRAPKYMIDNDRVALASITFKTTAGKSYTYDAAKAAAYNGSPDVTVDLNKFMKASAAEKDASTAKAQAGPTLIAKTSDVDTDIPVSNKRNDNTFALVVCNENYKNVANVASALHDGHTFRDYCEKTFGVPSSQIIFLPDATSGDFWAAYDELRGRVAAREGNTDIILYYSGHGLPDNDTKDAYLLPVDAQPQSSRTLIRLQEVYDGLSGIPGANLMAFMDACFSGSARESGQKDTPIEAARGVALKHRDVTPKGNLFVLSAASAQQTAFPYEEKDHGMFTYWLLKKLHETKGGATLGELADYVKANVSRTSYEINKRAQDPTHTASGELASTWQSKKLKP